MDNTVKCISCRYARQDKKASEYSVKHCAKCEARDTCEVCRGCKKQGECRIKLNPNLSQSCERRQDTVCGRQTLHWKAIECTNPDSIYHKALLNITPCGDMQTRVTWKGCDDGERRRSV